MTKTAKAAWALIGISLVLTVTAMIVYAVTDKNLFSVMAYILTPLWTAALALLGFAYRDLVIAPPKDNTPE